MIDEITDEIENAGGIVTEDVVGIETETGETQNTLKDRAIDQCGWMTISQTLTTGLRDPDPDQDRTIDHDVVTTKNEEGGTTTMNETEEETEAMST